MRSTEWEIALRAIGPQEHVQAIGAFALFYNALELALHGFFEFYLFDTPKAMSLLYARLHNRDRVDLIKSLASEHPRQEMTEAIEYGMRCFDVCAENRNLILHGLHARTEPEHLTLAKGSKDRPGVLKEYRFSLAEIQEAALAISRTESYLYALYDVLLEDHDFRRSGAQPGASPPPLPDRPALPRKLSLSQLLEAPEDETPPPRSGRG